MTLMITDLSVSKELEGQAVRGGFTYQGNTAGGAVAVLEGGGIGNIALAVNVPEQFNINTPVILNMPLAIGIAGQAVAI